jgi:hypothetical protein
MVDVWLESAVHATKDVIDTVVHEIAGRYEIAAPQKKI